MYARKYENIQSQTEEEPIRIPEKYDGSAFEREPVPCIEPPRAEEREEAAFPFDLSKLLSSDLLLLLLAFLLMGSGEGDDIAGILIFLLLL